MCFIKDLESVVITEVDTLAQQRVFLEMPARIYREDPQYIRPLDKDITDIFDPAVNHLLHDGACRRWLLWSQNEECIGRIAAFYTIKTEVSPTRRVGGIGFFECIDNQNAANLLLDQAKYWLESEGICLINGPINFGNRHNWWGLMIQGEGHPNYCCNYHPMYYRRLFENYGFELSYKQFTFRFEQQETQNGFFKTILMRFKAENGFEFKQADSTTWLENAIQFQRLYNNTWARVESLPMISLDQVFTWMNKLKDILDWRLIWFAYFNGEPVAFFVGIPELNGQIMKYVNGKIRFKDRFRLATRKWSKSYEKAYGMYFGVLESFQRTGVGLGLIAAMQDAWMTRLSIPYRSIEFGWVGAYNPKLIKLMKLAGGEIIKTHLTYRFWI